MNDPCDLLEVWYNETVELRDFLESKADVPEKRKALIAFRLNVEGEVRRLSTEAYPGLWSTLHEVAIRLPRASAPREWREKMAEVLMDLHYAKARKNTK